MTLLAPGMLWSLVVLAPLAAIYFLKVRPRRKPTTAYFLWERIFQERRASSLFQRLRDAWSLVLMLLAAAAVCLALARPEWADERKDLFVVLDASASMGAREGGQTRKELAAAAARDIVEGLNGNQLAAVAMLDGRLVFLSHLTDNPRELIEAINRVRPGGKELNLAALPDGGEGQTNGAREHRILLITDGAFDQSKLPAHVELLKVGRPRDNVGLVAADMAFIGGASRLGFFYQAASSYADVQQADLTLSVLDAGGQEQLFKVIPLRIEPGVNPPETFELRDAPPGKWIARIDVNDALPADNIAYLVAEKPEPVRVAVDATDPFFFENAVQAFSQGEGLLTLVREGKSGEHPPDAVLAKSTTPEADAAVIFQPAGNSPWWTDLGDEIEAGPARMLVEGHPALRHVDATSIPFVGARQLTAPPGAQVLVADDKGLPLIYKSRRDGRTALVVNLDPIAADFYFSAWFPVLVHSAATHLAGREHPLAAAYRPGEAVPIPGGRDDVVTTIAAPGGSNGIDERLGAASAALRASAESNGRFSDSTPDARHALEQNNATVRGAWFGGVDQLGFYQLANDAGVHGFGADVFSAAETLIGNEQSSSKHDPLSRGRSPAHWLTLLAIVILVAESMLYHRRKVG